MSEHTYKMIELVGSSHTSIEEAVNSAVAKAAIDEKSLRWFEVLETRGHIEDGKVARWQVRGRNRGDSGLSPPHVADCGAIQPGKQRPKA